MIKNFFNGKIFKFVFKYIRNRSTTNQKIEEIVSLSSNNDAFSRRKIKANLYVTNYKKFTPIKFPLCPNPLVSIIIPVHDNFKFTYNCLAAIKKFVDAKTIPYEVIIIDDVSDDLSKNAEKVISNTKIIHNKQNLGFLKNINLGAKISKGKYLYLLNNDTIPQPNFLSELIKYMQEHKDVGAAGSKLVYKNGLLQEAGGIIWKDGSSWNYGNGKSPNDPHFNYVKDVDYVSGASLLTRKDIWIKIGGFDERYAPAYNEDSDYCVEVHKLGYRVVYIPTSVLVHFEGISNGKKTGTGIKHYQLINIKKFREKQKKYLSKHFSNGEHVFWARDNSQQKKCILVIDHYVPTYDKDAGSKTVFSYLKLFVEMGYNVKFIGDNFARQEPYTTSLQMLGIEVLYGEYMKRNWRNYINVNRSYIDFVLLNRPHISIKYIDYIKKYTNAKILYYGHDLHTLRIEREYEQTHNKATLKEMKRISKMENHLFAKSDIIYFPSPIEVDIVKKNNPNYNVKILQPYMYDNKTYTSNRKRHNLLFVGGFSHAPNIDACVWFVRSILPIIQKKVRDVTFNIVGSNAPKEISDLKSKNVNIVGYVSDKKLSELYLTNTICVAPLRYGAGIKGKIIEAMYYSIPIVTTSCGAEGISNAEKSLLIANSADDFAKSVIKLISDSSLQKHLSDNEKKCINKNYSLNSAKNIIKRDFA